MRRRSWIAVLLLVACSHRGPSKADPSLLPPDADDPIANAPRLLVDDPTTPDKTLLPADATYRAAHEDEIGVAMALARAALKEQDRYKGWQREGRPYDTWLYFRDNGNMVVHFAVHGTTDTDISIEVDVAAHAIVTIRLGYA